MKLWTLIESLPIHVCSGDRQVEIRWIADDSRRVRPGSLFVARRGTAADGRKYVDEAIRRGAAAVLSDRPIEVPGPAVLTADDPAGVGVELARRFYGDPAAKLRLIGITGTNGKTTTTYMVRHLLAGAGIRCGLIGTVETDTGASLRPSELTTPGAIELIGLLAEMTRHGCGACAMEVSSHALDQGRVEGLNFAVAAFTNLTGDHLDYHKTMDAYADAKARLFESLNSGAFAVVNHDDPASARMLRDCTARRISYGEKGGDCRAIVHGVTSQQTDCSFEGSWGALRAGLPLIGRHNVANMAAALCCAHALGVDVRTMGPAIEACPQVPGRLERVGTDASSFDVFVDYAHTDDALANVLRALRPLTGGRLRVMFGCGGDRDPSKRPRMGRVACQLADQVVITSDNPRTEDPRRIIEDIRSGIPAGTNGRVATVEDRAAAIDHILSQARPGDVVLLAGKGHEDYQIIGTEKRPFDDRKVVREALARQCESTP